MTTQRKAGPAIVAGLPYSVRLKLPSALLPEGAALRAQVRRYIGSAVLAELTTGAGSLVIIDEEHLEIRMPGNASTGWPQGTVLMDFVRTDTDEPVHLGFQLKIPVKTPVTRGAQQEAVAGAAPSVTVGTIEITGLTAEVTEIEVLGTPGPAGNLTPEAVAVIEQAALDAALVTERAAEVAGHTETTVEAADAALSYSLGAAQSEANVELLEASAAEAKDAAEAAAASLAEVDTAAFNNRVTYSTWASLVAVTGSAGATAEVLPSDAGAHTGLTYGTDVTTAGLANAGIYVWSASPAGWRRVFDASVLGKASSSDITAGTRNDLAATPAALKPTVETVAKLNATLGSALLTAESFDVVFGVSDSSSGRVAPVLGKNGRHIQALEDGSFEYVPTSTDVRDLAEEVAGGGVALMAGLINGERPASVELNASGRIVRAITLEGREYLGTDTGLKALAKQDEILVPPPAPSYDGVSNQGVSLIADTTVCFIVVTLGQSNGEGQGQNADTIVASTAIYPSDALSFAEGPRTRGIRYLAAVPLVEQVRSNLRETAASGWVNHLIRDVEAAVGRRPRFLAVNAAQSGTAYKGLCRGQVPYRNMLWAVQDAVAICKAQGWRPIVLGIDWMQGETDALVPAAVYSGYLRQLARQADADLRQITGQVEPIPLFVTQIGYVVPDQPFRQDVQQAQQAVATDPLIRLVGPLYPYPVNDVVHVTCLGQNYRGQALARATFAEMFGTGWQPIRPISHKWISATQFEVEFSVPVAPLVLDSSGTVISTAGIRGHLGFQFDDGSGAAPAITAASVQSQRSVRFTLGGAPTGKYGLLAYATQRDAGNVTSQDGPVVGARGCLRDSAAHVNLYNSSTQANWCTNFIRDIGLP